MVSVQNTIFNLSLSIVLMIISISCTHTQEKVTQEIPKKKIDSDSEMRNLCFETCVDQGSFFSYGYQMDVGHYCQCNNGQTFVQFVPR